MNLEQAIKTLKPLKDKNKLIILVGAGMSIDSGLPSWKDFNKNLIVFCEDLALIMKGKGIEDAIIQDFEKAINSAKAELESNPMWIISILKAKLAELDSRKVIQSLEQFYNTIMVQYLGKQPNINHYDIIECNFPYIVTTNYDDLLMKAALKLRNTKLYLNDFDFTQHENIASCLYIDEPAIIHMHGKATMNMSNWGYDRLILTKDDYQRIKKDRPAFAHILRILFVKYSVLFVGYGENDPHISDIIEEVNYFFPTSYGDIKLPTYFVVSKESKITSGVKKIYNKLNRTEIINIDEYSDYRILFDNLKPT